MVESSANGVEKVNYLRNPTGAPGVRLGKAFPRGNFIPAKKKTRSVPKSSVVSRTFPYLLESSQQFPSVPRGVSQREELSAAKLYSPANFPLRKYCL